MSQRLIPILAVWSAMTITSPATEPRLDPLPDANGSVVEPNAPLTLPRAWAAALLANPDLGASAWERRAQEAAVLQAGLRPNPELEVLMEQFGGSGARAGFDQAETTVQVSQRVETAQKRQKRRLAAALETERAGWDYEAKRLDVLVAASKAFAEVLACQQRLSLAADLVRVAEQTRDAIAERVKAGKASSLEQTKAEVALSYSRVEQDRSSRSLEAARRRLAGTWGSHTAIFGRVEGDFYQVMPVPEIAPLMERLSQNPDMARWDTELKRRGAILAAEKAKRTPDVTVIVGVRNYQDGPGTAMVMGVALPLPLFDRNAGGIDQAQALLTQGHLQTRAARLRIETSLAETYQALAAATEQVTAMRTSVLPGAEQAFNMAREGYRQGKFGYLDVLDAQRTWFEAQSQYVEALAAYHQAFAELNRLAAGYPASDGTDRPHPSGVKP